MAESPVLSQMVRLILYPLITTLHIASGVFHVLSFTRELSAIASGTVASGLIGTAYLTPLLAVVKMRTKRSGRRN